MNKRERIKYGKEVERLNKRFENRFMPRVLAVLNQVRDGVTAALRSGGTSEAFHLLQRTVSNPELNKVIKDLYTEVGVFHAKRMNRELQASAKGFYTFEMKRLGFNSIWAEFVRNYLQKFLLEKITFAVSDTTREKLLAVLNDGINQGLSIDELVKRIDDLPFLSYQAARIVRTEIKRAGEAGARAASETFGFEQQKEWISILDTRTRGNPANGFRDHANHWAMDGQIVDSDQPFIDPRDGQPLMFPGDPKADGADTINCRCTHAYVAKRDENGRLIPKKTAPVLIPAYQ